MAANKGESDRCIAIARKAIASGNYKKATKFLEKSIRLFDTQIARQLLSQIEGGSSNNNEPSQPQPQPQPQSQFKQQSQSQFEDSKSQQSASSDQFDEPNTQPNASNNSNSDEKIDWSQYFSLSGDSATPQSPNSSFRSNASNASNTSNAANRSSSRLSSSEEVAMVKKILRSKDYYEMLDVSKNATDDELKKKYRKLALKLHPDRNKAPGAEEAFKKLSSAYDCLRDSNKRNYYDQYGTDSPQTRNGNGAHFQQMTPDDIIRMFFGGDFGGTGSRHGGSSFVFHGPGHRFRQSRRRQGDATSEESQGGSLVMLMQLLPILLIFVTMFLPSLLSSSGNTSLNTNSRSSWEGQYFNLKKSGSFVRQEETRLGTKYYLKRQYNQWGINPLRNKNNLEEQVEASYLNYLIKECDSENQLYSENWEKIKENDIDPRKRIKMLKTIQKTFSGDNSVYNSNYRRGNGNGKICRKLDEYLDRLA